jgi:hypothetical protein
MAATFDPPVTAADIVRGSCRLLWLQGWSARWPSASVTSASADLMAVSRTGELLIVEIKVSAADLKGDRKWHHYQGYADRFAWAVPPALAGRLDEARYGPEACGLIIADRHEAIWMREAGAAPLAAARRKAVLLSFARMAAERMMRLSDPGFEGFAAW